MRKSGERVRITAQLIDVASGTHLWSETYDRILTDIFAVQDNVASEILNALQVHVGAASDTWDSHRRPRGLLAGPQGQSQRSVYTTPGTPDP